LWFETTLDKKLARLHLNKKTGCGGVHLFFQLGRRKFLKFVLKGKNAEEQDRLPTKKQYLDWEQTLQQQQQKWKLEGRKMMSPKCCKK
jgi:hypothetical protein